MPSVLRVLLPLVAVLAWSLPSGADPGPVCALGEGPTGALQDDAGSGGDAGDDATVPLHVLADATWAGALELPAPGGPGDQADAYRASVGPAAQRVMVRLESYTGLPLEDVLVVDVFEPGSSEPADTVALGAGDVTFDPAVGPWTLVVRFAAFDAASCGPGMGVPVSTPGEVSTLLKSYTLYIGCDPVCVEA